MKVMIAIRISGTFAPPISSANTSDGSGHGTVVDIRTVMYEIRKQLKMKVPLRRKIHIMAFPQDALLNVRWSDAQSAAISRKPRLGSRAWPDVVTGMWSMSYSPLR